MCASSRVLQALDNPNSKHKRINKYPPKESSSTYCSLFLSPLPEKEKCPPPLPSVPAAFSETFPNKKNSRHL